jgi:hypothetical protein
LANRISRTINQLLQMRASRVEPMRHCGLSSLPFAEKRTPSRTDHRIIRLGLQ